MSGIAAGAAPRGFGQAPADDDDPLRCVTARAVHRNGGDPDPLDGGRPGTLTVQQVQNFHRDSQAQSTGP